VGGGGGGGMAEASAVSMGPLGQLNSSRSKQDLSRQSTWTSYVIFFGIWRALIRIPYAQRQTTSSLHKWESALEREREGEGERESRAEGVKVGRYLRLP